MLPAWLPEVAVTYLAHTAAGLPIRALARAKGCHASTVLRQVRRVEAWRDDPLIDEALERMSRAHAAEACQIRRSQGAAVHAEPGRQDLPRPPGDARIEREARRILRRLCEKGAFLAVAPSMEKAVVLREVVPGKQNRIAVVDRDVAHAFALQEWIGCEKAGKIACYTITPVGRAALKRLLTEERVGAGRRRGLRRGAGAVPGAAPLLRRARGDGRGRLGRAAAALQPRREPAVGARAQARQGRRALPDRRADRGGRAAARGLRAGADGAAGGAELGPLPDRRRARAGRSPGAGRPRARSDARVRVAKAMEALGPGLSDIVFRICCFLEGLETAEKRLGWSARSGKVVLKIALERLAVHYGIAPGAAARAAG